MPVWTEVLKPSEVAYMNGIIEQVPQEMGARDAFINILQGLADKVQPPKFRFYRASTMDGCVYGIKDEAMAIEVAESEEDYVVDTQTNEWIMADGERQEITECE